MYSPRPSILSSAWMHPTARITADLLTEYASVRGRSTVPDLEATQIIVPLLR